jgi:peroxiredoxin
MKLLLIALLIITLSGFAFAQQNTGVTAQNFSVTTLDGETFELEKLRGKVVVMTFWSTRCQICHAEIPKLNKMADHYKDSEVIFLGLAWQDKKKLDRFLMDRPFNFKIVPQSFGVLLKYAARDKKGRLNMGYPSHFVVDQQGMVVFKGEGFSKTKKLNSTIDGLLKRIAVVASQSKYDR